MFHKPTGLHRRGTDLIAAGMFHKPTGLHRRGTDLTAAGMFHKPTNLRKPASKGDRPSK